MNKYENKNKNKKLNHTHVAFCLNTLHGYIKKNQLGNLTIRRSSNV